MLLIYIYVKSMAYIRHVQTEIRTIFVRPVAQLARALNSRGTTGIPGIGSPCLRRSGARYETPDGDDLWLVTVIPTSRHQWVARTVSGMWVR